ncbi:SAM-dependent methyltransferase [Rhodopseudomonas rhenobacensis]|uniref:SAM-dependent methyltransferase n=1 Tax=Rhodopseudomonas rhenobacensis TaxID=87461 RepID=A0A7W7Z730_9BRAD|nr:class I SAM-dependent methyltransferase [Rhodopseudomonas rhenobacensis]MBB5048687.1 SAM-dependent methyltransferase [Rhodopseudomonas rhenobacensis]
MLWSWARNWRTRREAGEAARANWDRRYGTDTAGRVPLDRLTIPHDSRRHGERYQPSDPAALRDAIGFIGLSPSAYQFVDLGCGKGRMLIVAAELGFQSCVGVEFADELARAAARNVAAAGFGNVSIVHGDAGTYAFGEAPFVLYMFNPFAEPVMARVRDNLLRQRRANYVVIYKNARFRHLFDAMPRLRYLGSPPTQRAGVLGVHVWVACEGAESV